MLGRELRTISRCQITSSIMFKSFVPFPKKTGGGLLKGVDYHYFRWKVMHSKQYSDDMRGIAFSSPFFGVLKGVMLRSDFGFIQAIFFEWCDFIRTWNIGKSRQKPQKSCYEQGVGWLNGSDSPLDACLELRSWVAKDNFGFSTSQVGEFRIEGSGAAGFPWNFGAPKRLGLMLW